MAKFFGANNIDILDATSGVVKIGGAIGSAPFKLLDVIYKAPGTNKISVIKVVREITGFGLKEAKELVDNPPKAVKEGVTKEEAEKVRKMLAEAGAEVEVK